MEDNALSTGSDRLSKPLFSLMGYSELFIRTVDENGDPVGSVEIELHDGSSNPSATSADTFIVGAGITGYNWLGEVSGEGDQDELALVTIDPQVDYIIYTDLSTNQIWYRWEFQDTYISLDVDEGEFELVTNEANSVVEFIEADITSVDLGSTPYTTGVQSTIEWEVEWFENSSPPDIYPTTAKVDLITASGNVNLSTSEAQLSGDGSFLWTPQQTYTDVKIRVTDEYTGSFSESSTFDVQNSVALEADITGPSLVNPDIENEWESDVEGGAVPYSYEWEYWKVCEESSFLLAPTCGEWHWAGSGSSMEWTFLEEGDVILRLTVTDEQNAEDVATKEITVADF